VGVAHVTNSVSPPAAHLAARESDTIAGTGLKELSVCQSWCRTVEHAPVRPIHEPTVVIGIRVGEVDEVGCRRFSWPVALIVSSSGPKRRLEGHLRSSVSRWSWKTSTDTPGRVED